MAIARGAADRRPRQCYIVTLRFWLIALAYVVLGLLEVSEIRRQVEALNNREVARVLLDGSAATAVKFRKYLWVRTQMSALTGLLVALFAWMTGLQFARRVGRDRICTQLYPLCRPFHCNTISDTAGDDSFQ
jgi:hypothetical protein